MAFIRKMHNDPYYFADDVGGIATVSQRLRCLWHNADDHRTQKQFDTERAELYYMILRRVRTLQNDPRCPLVVTFTVPVTVHHISQCDIKIAQGPLFARLRAFDLFKRSTLRPCAAVWNCLRMQAARHNLRTLAVGMFHPRQQSHEESPLRRISRHILFERGILGIVARMLTPYLMDIH